MITAAWKILLELSPWLLLGTAIAGLLHAFVPAEWFRRRLTGRSGILTAVLFGIPLPLCSCSVIPVGLGLRRNGASDSAAVGFLISTPQTGVDSILVSASMLGWPFAVFKVVAALVMGLTGGLVTRFLEQRQPDAQPVEDVSVVASECTSERRMSRLHTAFRHAVELIRSIWRWLLFGIVISAALTWNVPPDLLTQIPGLTGVPAMLATLLLSLPLYVCAVASVPIAAALVSSGLPGGAAMVFLMAGPATNVTTLGAVYRTFGGKTLAVYLATMITGSLGAGLLFDFWLRGIPAAEYQHNNGLGWFSSFCAVLLLAMLSSFCVQDVRRWLRLREKRPAALMLSVSGMTCENCAESLERALCRIEDVVDAEVTFHTSEARIFGNPPLEQVLQVVSNEGFQASNRCAE